MRLSRTQLGSRLVVALLVGSFGFAPAALADEPVTDAPPAVTAKPSGQLLVRYRHHEGHDFTSGGVRDFVTQRARLGLRLDFGAAVGAFVQLQDVRVWGEEGDTLGDYSAGGLDLHQGYVDVGLAEGMTLRVGRQEIAYLNHRLIGNVGFVEQARSFDAARWSYAADALTADVFYARTRDGAAADYTGATDVLAGFFQYRLDPAFVPAFIAVVDISGPAERTRVTAGLHATGALDFGLSYSLEGYYQGGSAAGDVSYAAYLAALHARYTLKSVGAKPFVEFFAELVSGDDDPTDADVKTFDTLFATNHKFYGEMDFFLNLPANTGGRGLMDLGVTLGAAPADGVTVALTAHLFSAMDDQGGDGAFGTELDLKATWKPVDHLALDLVYAVFLPGDGSTGGASNADAEHFVYATVDASF